MADNLNLDVPSFNFGEDFGITSTNVLSSDELDNFLGSDPDAVEKIEENKEGDKSPAKTNPIVKKDKSSEEENKEEVKEPSEEEVLNEVLGSEEEEKIKEVQEKNKPKEEVPKEDEDPKEEEINTFTALSKELADLGVFTPDEEGSDPISTPQQFLEKFNNEIQKKGINWVEDFLGNFGDDRKELFNAIYLNGVDPQEYLSQFVKIEDLSNLNLDIVSNQERVIRDYYRSVGWEQSRIEAKVERLKSIDGLDEEAKEKHEILIAQESQDLARQEEDAKLRVQNKQRIEQEYNTNVHRILTDKIKAKDFDGIPVTQEFAKQTSSFLTQNKYKLPNGELLTEFDKELLDLRRPENHEKKVKLAMLLQIMKTDPTLSKLKKTAVSQESNELFRTLQRDKKEKNKKGGDTQAVTSWF